MKPSDKNFEVSLPGSTTYTKSWGSGGVMPQSGVKYAKENRGGFRRPKPRGWLPPLPYTLDHLSFDRGSGMCYRLWTTRSGPPATYWDRFDGDVGGGQGSPVDSVNAAFGVMPRGGGLGSLIPMEEEVISSCYKKARQMTVNLGVAFGEAHKTASLIADTAYTCARSIHALRRGNWRAAAQILGVSPGRYSKNWARKWTEWKYGWMPLLSDIYGSAEALSRRDTSDWKVSASARKKIPLNAVAERGSGFTRTLVEAKGWAGVHCRMDFVPTDLRDLASMGVTNPALLGWEVLPHSFVLDWMVPVGDWLLGLDHDAFFASGTQCVSRFVKQEWTMSGLNDSEVSGNYNLDYTNGWSGWIKSVVLTRWVGALEPPSFPRLRNPLKGFGRMVTALALLRNAFK